MYTDLSREVRLGGRRRERRIASGNVQRGVRISLPGSGMVAVPGSLEPSKIVLDASQILHQLDLLLFSGGQGLLDVVKLRPDGLHLLQGVVAAPVDAGAAQGIGRRVFGLHAVISIFALG